MLFSFNVAIVLLVFLEFLRLKSSFSVFRSIGRYFDQYHRLVLTTEKVHSQRIAREIRALAHLPARGLRLPAGCLLLHSHRERERLAADVRSFWPSVPQRRRHHGTIGPRLVSL